MSASGRQNHGKVVTIEKTVGIARNLMVHPRPNISDAMEAPRSGMFFWMILASLVGASGTLYFLSDKLGAIAMIPLAVGAWLGYRSGAWKMLSMLLGSACGYYFAAPTAVHIVPIIENAIGKPISNPSLEIGLSGVVAGLVASLLLIVFGWLVIRRNPCLKMLDQNFGMLVGVTKSSALVAVGLWTVLAMEPHMIKQQGNQRVDKQLNNVSLYHRFLGVAEATRSSPVLSHLAHWNPIITNPMLNDLLTKSQAMILKVKSQTEAARSGHLPPGSSLTGLMNELQSQGSLGNLIGSQN
jgi:uncharacterized membrane protein required for colicin V production